MGVGLPLQGGGSREAGGGGVLNTSPRPAHTVPICHFDRSGEISPYDSTVISTEVEKSRLMLDMTLDFNANQHHLHSYGFSPMNSLPLTPPKKRERP